MMRVISGEFKGRKLKRCVSPAVRPTKDRVREAVFNAIAPSVCGARVLDLFSGTGAMGIEALSRGAYSAVFVDSSSASVRVIRHNLSLIGRDARVIRGSVYRSIKRLSGNLFDIVFADPPYNKGMVKNILSGVAGCSILKNSSLIVVEHSRREPLEQMSDFYMIKNYGYGDTAVSIYRYEKHDCSLPGDV